MSESHILMISTQEERWTSSLHFLHMLLLLFVDPPWTSISIIESDFFPLKTKNSMYYVKYKDKLS